MNPHDRYHDISSGTLNAPMIVAYFSEAHALLKQQMGLFETTNPTERRSSGILGVILGANYQSYKEKRYILRSVHERLVTGEASIVGLVNAHRSTDVLPQAIRPSKFDPFADRCVDNCKCKRRLGLKGRRVLRF